MSNYNSDSGEVKDQARQQAGEVKDHAVTQGREVKDHAAGEAGAVKDHAVGEAAAVKDHAAGEATAVKDHAAGAARDVATTAQTEAKSVAQDARSEIRGLVDSGLNELNTQMGTGQGRLASELRNVVDELSEMVQGSQRNGMATQFARELSNRGDGIVGWLDTHEPRDAVTEVRRYAARNPWTFLAVAAGAGLLVGRFARGLRDDNADDSSNYQAGYSGQTAIGTGYSAPPRAAVYGYESGTVRGTQDYGRGDVTAAPNTGYDEALDYNDTTVEGERAVGGYRPGETAQGFNAQYGEGQFGNPGDRR